mgnify:FL=1
MALRYLAGNRIEGLSTDTKPTTVQSDCVFYETNTRKIYDMISGSWTERTSGLTGSSNLTLEGKTQSLGDWVIMQKTKPSVATNLVATADGSTTITATYDVIDTDKVSAVKVEYSLDNSAWTTATTTADDTSYQVTGLAIYTDYYFRVYPSNIMGESTATTTGSVTKTHGTIPNTPTNLAVTNPAGNYTQLDLTWTASTGDIPTATYKIEYKLNSSGTWLVASASESGTSYSITGLLPYLDYDVRISGFNPQGSSAVTSVVTHKTTGLAPAQVSGLTLSEGVNPTRNTVTVAWSATSGQPSLMTYTIEHSLSSTFASGVTVVNTTSGLNTTDVGVAFDVAHYYRVKATNTVGVGAYSAISTITVLGPFINAVGATFSQSGGYDYYTWTSSGSVEVYEYAVEILAVAGGGGNGGGHNGGAGGGEVMRSNVFTFPTGSQTVTVGGGSGDTSIANITAKAGGNGGGIWNGSGIAGGSGGGGAGCANGPTSSGAGGSSKLSFPAGITGDIYGNGGGGGRVWSGGGGGGATGGGGTAVAGSSNYSQGGNGGTAVSIAFPTTLLYGGGQGGGARGGGNGTTATSTAGQGGNQAGIVILRLTP